jgi:hypothetical protein
MTSRILASLLAAAIAAAALPVPLRAIEIAEKRGDFYYDGEDRLVAVKHVDVPDADRRPMSSKEKMALLGLELPAARAALQPRYVEPKPPEVAVHATSLTNVIAVKFRDDRPVRLSNGRWSSAGPAAAADAIVATRPGARVERMFRTDERILDEDRETGQLLGGRALPDLNNWYRIVLPEGADGRALANELLALDDVETAYFETAPAEPPACGDVAPTPPDWEASQFHLDAAPAGVDARYAWGYHFGGDGHPGFWVIDIEYSWCYLHEDYNADTSAVLNGIVVGGFETQDHGTSVLGLIGGCDNGFGMTGITDDVTMRMVDVDNGGIPAAITTASSYLFPGEIMLLEQQVFGPSGELLPVEWAQASFDAITVAVANGFVVVEAAANGGVNLDSAAYGGKFNPAVRHSGATLVGSSNLDHSVRSTSNYGSRVDVHSYGTGIWAPGYGDWFSSGSTCNQDYTTTFGGTSGASAIVTGAAVSLQGIANAKYGIDLTPFQMNASLRVGGTPQGAPTANNIGPMPNLVAAINEVEPDLSPLTPTGWSYPVVPRSVTGTTGSSCPLGAAALPGGGNTYWNFAEENNPAAYAPTVNNSDHRVYVEDAWYVNGFGGNLNPGGWQYGADVLSLTVKGGRHSVHFESDWENVEAEWIETNNLWSRQFIWSGLTLAEDVPATRTFDPVAFDARWPGPFYNAEGVQATPAGGYWHAFAVMPAGATDDFDVRLNTEAPANIPQAGFGASVVGSFTGPGEIAVVAWDQNEVTPGTHWASVLNFGGTGSKVVEFESDDGTLATGVNGPFTIQAGDLIDVHELFLGAGTEYRVHIEVLSGSADFGISVLDGTSGYHDKVSTVMPGGYADNAGSGEDEWVVVSPTTTDFRGLLVWKAGSVDRTATLTFNVIVSTAPNLVGSRTPNSWDYPIVPRNTRDAVLLVDLPATLNGNQPTTSLNWATYNEGANQAAAPWRTDLRVDDVLQFLSTAGTLNSGAYWVVMNTTQITVDGGRHHVRSTADAVSQLAEFDEADNNYTDWFVWSPMDVSTVAGTRPVPDIADPVGYGPWFSCDGYTATGGSGTYWTAVSILPVNAVDDYDIRLHNASTGSRSGFDNPLTWSDGGPGLSDFVIVNHNVLPQAAYDYGVLNRFGGSGGFEIRQSDAPYHGVVGAGVTRYGPFTMNTPEPVELHEFFVDAGLVGVPVYLSLNRLTGTPDLGLAVYDGALGTHSKFSALATVDAAPGGQDEHLGPVFFPAANYYAVAVFKHGSADVAKAGQYELVFSTGSSAVDAPEVGPVPAEFALAAPSPNPFRGAATTVRFDLPVPADVKVSVYDLAGRRVATLADGRQPAGRHAVAWDGRDGAGSRVGAGVYFVRLESPEFSRSRKVTLLR